MVFRMDGPEEAWFVGGTVSVDVMAVLPALLASEESPAHRLRKVLGVVVAVAHGPVAAVSFLPVLAAPSVSAGQLVVWAMLV